MSIVENGKNFYVSPDMSHAFLGLSSILQTWNSVSPSSALHTQGLERKYGIVSARIIQHTDTSRIIDIIDQGGICRTHAITWFPPVKHEELRPVYEEIAHGGLIGKTLQKYGYQKVNVPIAEGVVGIPFPLRERFATAEEFAYCSLYIFLATNFNSQHIFGSIAEIYSPDFQQVTDTPLQIYTHVPSDQASPFLDSFQEYLSILGR